MNQHKLILQRLKFFVSRCQIRWQNPLRQWFWPGGWLLAALLAGGLAWLAPQWLRLSSGYTIPQIIMYISLTAAGVQLGGRFTRLYLARQGKPDGEALMLAQIYRLCGWVAIVLLVLMGAGRLTAFTGFFTLFGGMLLGWSLQSPVSGFAAWILILLKRPFRPGDRIQFPMLDLTGDVQEIGAMYITLNQVGGSIAGEEAVGRSILLPNAMLFQQVIINYTAIPDAPYMLDEVIIRITYDSNWERAEKILLQAAWAITQETINATGEHPYIRSELYDYGVYLRLRYQTRVKDRAETAYRIEKRIFEEIQQDPLVDIAIPYVYSYRAVMEGKVEVFGDRDLEDVQEIDLDRINSDNRYADTEDISQLARSIQAHGLLQPIIVMHDAATHRYDLVAGHLRFAACRKLGWQTIPAVVRTSD